MSNWQENRGATDHEDRRTCPSTGLAPSRIRFYERIGLLQAAGRQANGYRAYTAQAERMLRLITAGQRAGFSLDELRTLLAGDLAQWDHDALLGTLRRKVQDIAALQLRLAQSRAQLTGLIAQIEGRPQDMDCAANARRVLSEMRFEEASADETAFPRKRLSGR